MNLELERISDLFKEPIQLKFPKFKLFFSLEMDSLNIKKLKKKDEDVYKSKLRQLSDLFNIHKDSNIFDSYLISFSKLHF